MNTQKLRGAGAVLAGFVVVIVLSTITDIILYSTGVYPPIEEGFHDPALNVLALTYRTAYTILGGYITARLAPADPMRHVRILAMIGLAAGILGVVSTWGMDLGPKWYPILLAILAYPSVIYGGSFHKPGK